MDSWPEGGELRTLCRLLVAQYPVPRVTREALQKSDCLSRIRLGPAATEDVEALRSRLQEWRARRDGALIPFHDPRYPALLREIARPPVVLFVEGDVTLLQRPSVAIVGARAAARSYCEWTRALSADLARCGVVIASGLARGVDAAAHMGALDAGGATLAVLGSGTDVSYPPENEAVQQRLVESGCVVSELPPGTPPRAWHFPSRNRVLAGLTRGVVVVQAEPKSGALITAKHALHENREVMAVPGEVLDPRSRGPHALLRQGAALVERAADVLEALGWMPLPRDLFAASPATSSATLLAQLQRPASLEELRQRLGWDAGHLQRVLLELELAGSVERMPSGRVRRAVTPS
ncbi:MAG: DNA-processing protein DprA [Candidatus Latescibacterota bacterium]|nr:MAG: DNA-processing protein DprA [Candidatus Latescibacterota bacterium]